MRGESSLKVLLASMKPKLHPEEYVFCSCDGSYGDFAELSPLATFREAEGLTLVVSREAARSHGLAYDSVFKVITLTVHSSLDAVGLTAAVATKLTENGISANVIAAYYHDHVFVQIDKAEAALNALDELAKAV